MTRFWIRRRPVTKAVEPRPREKAARGTKVEQTGGAPKRRILAAVGFVGVLGTGWMLRGQLRRLLQGKRQAEDTWVDEYLAMSTGRDVPASSGAPSDLSPTDLQSTPGPGDGAQAQERLERLLTRFHCGPGAHTFVSVPGSPMLERCTRCGKENLPGATCAICEDPGTMVTDELLRNVTTAVSLHAPLCAECRSNLVHAPGHTQGWLLVPPAVASQE